MKKYYITTPIYYPSGKLHLGHAYTTIAGDVLKRYKEQQGYDVFYLTGTDEHGEKIETKAKEVGKTPKQFVDDFNVDIKNLWKLLDVNYDKMIRTTDEEHKKQVQYIFNKLYEKGHIYLGEYTGEYCVSCESFFTDTQLVDGKCPDCGGDVQLLTEESYFFRTSDFVDKLLKHYEDNPEFILPISRKNELINSFIKPGLPDLAISRSSFKWGIPVPNDEDKVIYVWLDALTNYITALGYMDNNPEFEKYWPADVHLMGKEIIRFHAIYWPMFLMALDLPLPKQLFAHGWLLMDNDKMSKSKGNVIYSEYLVEEYGVDTLRYFLLREIPFGDDGYFTPENYIRRINNDIVNDLANLVNRTISMVNKYFDGTVVNDSELVKELLEKNHISFDVVLNNYKDKMDKLHFSKALEEVWKYISATNKFVDLTEPWVLAKNDDKQELNAVLYALVESIRKIAILIKPVFTTYYSEILYQIGYNEGSDFEQLNEIVEKYTVTSNPKHLISRLDESVEVEKISNEMKESLEVKKDYISFDEFKKVQMKVAKVESVKKHPNANKLLVFTLNNGNENITIVSGLAEHYNTEDLIGKKLIYVDNLTPVNLRGVKSQGMILTTDTPEGNVKVLIADDESEIGTIVQ